MGTFVRILLLFTGTRQSLASIQHPCVNTKDINMSSSQPLSSNPEAQNAASQQFHEKPIPSQTNGTFQPPQAVRQRHQQGNASHGVSQRDHNYNSPIGGYRNSSSDDTATYRSHRSHDPHHFKRRQIRHRLHQKHKQDGPVPVRLKWTKFMHSDTKNHAVAFMGEFVGTFMFLFFAFAGTQVANIGVGDSTDQSTTGSATGFNPATLLYIALSFGFSLMVNAWIFFRISGGLFNPAVTLALALLKALSPLRALLLFIAQGIFIEAICTAELVFTIVMLAGEKHRATFIAPVGIGLALFISELVAVYYTGGSLNPARSFAPCAVTHDFDSEHWIYWLGPFIGVLLAVGFYKLNKILEYEMVNPGQDGDAANDPTQNPDHEVAQAVEERAIEVEEIQAVEEQGGFDNLSTDGSVASLDPAVMEADPVADLDGHVRGAKTTTIGGVHKEDIEAQWPNTSQHEGR